MTFFSSEKKQKFPGAVKSKDDMFFAAIHAENRTDLVA